MGGIHINCSKSSNNCESDIPQYLPKGILNSLSKITPYAEDNPELKLELDKLIQRITKDYTDVLDYIHFCRNASVIQIFRIHDDARDLIKQLTK